MKLPVNIHQNDTIFRGILGCLESGTASATFCHAREKTLRFNIADLREVQKAEYVDSILARLSLQDLEQTIAQFEDEMKDFLLVP